MKKIKIRFVEREKDFLIQRKTLLGWQYIRWTHDMGYGSVAYCYCEDTKEKLLSEVLERYYKTDKRFIQVEEHPQLKIY